MLQDAKGYGDIAGADKFGRRRKKIGAVDRPRHPFPLQNPAGTLAADLGSVEAQHPETEVAGEIGEENGLGATNLDEFLSLGRLGLKSSSKETMKAAIRVILKPPAKRLDGFGQG